MQRRTKRPDGKKIRDKLLFLNLFPKTWQQSPEFRQMWSDWIQHRKEIGHKPTKKSTERQCKKLTACGLDTALDMINQSIENGWCGIFPYKESSNSTKGSQQASSFQKDKAIDIGFQSSPNKDRF